MNINVRLFEGKCIVRPDTTWERDNDDFYPPEDIDVISYTPVIFARISRPGRRIRKGFASRYYDGVNYGVLLYPEDMMDGSWTSLACASCIDHTSFLPTPVYNKITLGPEDNFFILKKNGRKIFSTNKGSLSMLEDAICEATAHTFIRTGDVLAVELQPRKRICCRKDGQTRISATFCDNDTIDFKIIR